MANYTTQNDLLMKKLLDFYRDENHLNKMLGIINGKSLTSLRIVDWFVTNYAKKYYTTYTLKDNTRFKVYPDYKLRLRAYSKRRFDPFCRWERIMMPTGDDTGIQTTIGQLNFFKWAIDNLIIDYIKEYYDKIEMDMNNSYNDIKVKKKEKKDKKERKKRQELSKSASRGLNTNKMKVVLDFN